MADQDLSKAKAVLLAVQLTRSSDISALRTLVANYPRTLVTEIVLRILLSHLPETLDSAEYVPLLQDLASGNITEPADKPVDASALEGISEGEASRKVKKLHLLRLEWPDAPADIPDDPFVRFVIHRALRIDKNTGLISQLPELLSPFLERSSFLRNWMISSILPMLRFYYEYHPYDGPILSICDFEHLDDRAGVALLLSRTDKNAEIGERSIGQDIRGLVGPWMYGDTKTKRRKIQQNHTLVSQTIVPLADQETGHSGRTGWEEVFKWLVNQGASSWETAVEAVEGWDGPTDVDLGGYGDGTVWLGEDEEQFLERKYARAALAAAYAISDASTEALTGVHRILNRIITLLDIDRIPHISAAAALLSPVPRLGESAIMSSSSAKYLRNHLLDEENLLTSPKEDSTGFLHALLISAYLITRAGQKCTIRRAGELVLLKDEREQRAEFRRLIYTISNGPKADNKHWARVRNEILWLHGWGAEELEDSESSFGRGVFGLVDKTYVETEILKLLLANTRYDLAKSIYVDSPEQPLSLTQLQNTIIVAAMNAYDNATNPNKTRGGVKKCDDILNAFPDTLKSSLSAKQSAQLIRVTHALGNYALVLTKGEPFRPVQLRVHGDPISIIEKILSQNAKSYTRIDEFMSLGEGMVDAGLVHRDVTGQTLRDTQEPTRDEIEKQKATAKRRILGMCIVNALASEDFETAYSYVVTRLKNIASPAQETAKVSEVNAEGLFAELPPKNLDEWSWLAAFQAGKYRRSSRTLKPTHLGNTSGNLDIRHLEQRIECLAHALRLAPKHTLQEILNVYRRCEEELESLIKLEEEEEASWDSKGDETAMPGGFSQTPQRTTNGRSNTRDLEEAPMSLFDLSRTTMTRAQNSIGSLALLKSRVVEEAHESRSPTSAEDFESSRAATPDSAAAHMRKRDQLKSAAVGTLASGVGWLIGAPGPRPSSRDGDL